MESGTLAKVLHDFFTTEEGELSLNKGDIFLVHKTIDKHWCYGESHGKFGKFPLNRLHKIEIPEISDNEFLYISIATFKGEQTGDLSFNKGETIIGNAEETSGWLTGYIGPRKGMFPASYIWQLDLNMIKSAYQKKIVKRKAKVKVNLQAQIDEELDLVKGEKITVTEILDDGWCRGYNESGKEGIFPEGFITYLDEVDEVDECSSNSASTPNSFPQSALSGPIYKDFGESYSNSDLTQYDDPAPNYYDLFPDKVSRTQISSNHQSLESSDLNHSLGIEPYAMTLFPFNAQFPNELSFDAGQVVKLLKYIDNEWAEGMIDNTKGIFPVSYVNVVVDCANSQNDVIEEEKEIEKLENNLQIDDRVKVEYTFNAQMDGDLNVFEGEIVTVVEMPNDDWVKVRNEHKEIGLCPRSYLTTEFESSNETFHDAFEDFVMIRDEKKDPVEKEAERNKRLSEPHRPAPPAPTPGRIPLQKQNNQSVPLCIEGATTSSEKKKKADQRQNVITELYLTEKDYIRDLKMTYETFYLDNPNFLLSRGVDVTTLFGNISEIIGVSEELFELIQRAMKGCDEEYQTVGPCFLKMAEKMRSAYGRYCSNHDSSLTLLQKYENNKEIMKIFDKGVETLRMQVACFDMNSILIKPVQRILKYPLILNQLLKCTEDNHPDKSKIEEASKVMADVASYINEYKRKKELASKYLHSDNSLIGRMANLNMHSVAKKSSRLSAKLSATLGLTNLPTDQKFDELVKDFSSLEKSTKQLAEDVKQCLIYLDAETYCGEILTKELHEYYTGNRNDEIGRLESVRSLIRSRFLKDLQLCIEKRVVIPLNNLISLLAGPKLLINKRYDKMLDYDTAISRNEKSKERGIVEDLSNAKSNFEALNQQLLEELPIFIESAIGILYNCIGAFTNARKLYNAKIMRKYLAISESLVNQISLQDILESFLAHHNLLYNQISRLSYGGSKSRIEEGSADYFAQSEIHKKTLRQKYPPNQVYVVTQSVAGAKPHDLSLREGTVVGVIKTLDPMGDTSRWFVDNGTMMGFVEKQFLELSIEAQLIEENASIACQNNSVDLMCLDSPIKEAKRSSADLQSLYSDISDESDLPPNYENIFNVESKSQNIRESSDEYIYALYDFDDPKFPGTLPIKEGQALKVLLKHDQKNNSEWWLVENRSGGKGYVPQSYLGYAAKSKR